MMEYKYKAIVRDVYDGDTITVDIDLGFGLWMKDKKIRLYGINTPEIRGKDRDRGIDVRNYVQKKILFKQVTIETHKDSNDKYGRYLGVVLYDYGTNLNDELVEKGYAEIYMV